MRFLVLAAVTVLTLAASRGGEALAQANEAGPQPPAAPIPYPFLRASPQAERPKRPAPAPHRPRPPTQAGAAGAPSASARAGAAKAAVPSARGPAALPLPTAPVAAGQPIPPAELERFVDGVVHAAIARDHLAGAAVAVVHNGRIALAKGYGFADLATSRRVDPGRTLFRLGPVSETFTWIEVMRQVEAGRMGLSQAVNVYLPERAQVRDQGFDQPVRVADLMNHTTGFDERALGRLLEHDPDEIRPLEVYLRQERPRRVRPPGQSPSFAAYDAALAGEAGARAAGKPFEGLVEDDILRPLALSHTTFREPHPAREGLPAPMPAALAADAAQGYRWGRAGFERRPYEYAGQIAPALGASSTAADMGRYMLALLGGGQLEGAAIYGPRAAAALRTPLRPPPPGIDGWAHGFEMFDLPGGRRGFGASGGLRASHASLIVVPDLGLGVFVAANSEGGGRLVEALPRQLVQEFFAPAPAAPRPGSPELWDQRHAFTGYYLSSRRASGGLEGFVDLLTRGVRIGVTPDGRLVAATGKAVEVFAPNGPPAAGRFAREDGSGRGIVFQMADGRAQGFLPSDGRAVFARAGIVRTPRTLAWLAGLAAAAALATLAGLAARSRRDLRQTQVQAQASVAQNIQAGLWLLALALGLWWLWRRSGDADALMFNWPSAVLITASACALVAAALTISTVIALPAIWRGGRRLDSWTAGRKLAFTATVVVYAVFSLALANWGALSPWMS